MKTQYVLSAILTLLLPFLAYSQRTVLKFDGKDDYVNLGKDIGTGARSIELWFKPGIEYDNKMDVPSTLMYRNDLQVQEYGLYIGASTWPGEEGRVVFFRMINGKRIGIVSDTNIWESGRWYHVAGVIHPSDGMRLYIDGVQQKDTDTSTSPVTAEVSITALGTWGDAKIRYFTGSMSELRIWDRALTENDILDNMCDTIDPSLQTGLMSYWRMDEGTGTTLTDLSQSGNNRSIDGASWAVDTFCITVSLSPLQSPIFASVYPNPSSQIMNIDLPENGQYVLTVVNSVGQVVDLHQYMGAGKNTLDVSQWRRGLYYMSITRGDGLCNTVQVAIR